MNPPQGTGVESPRAWLMWVLGLSAYAVAVMQRTSLGVASLQATERFSAGASLVSLFVVVQLLTYAGMQVPVGVLADRFGTRVVVGSGAVLMCLGQLDMAFSTTVVSAIVSRLLVGAGDAMTLGAVLRLLPAWFRPQRLAGSQPADRHGRPVRSGAQCGPARRVLGVAGWTTDSSLQPRSPPSPPLPSSSSCGTPHLASSRFSACRRPAFPNRSAESSDPRNAPRILDPLDVLHLACHVLPHVGLSLHRQRARLSPTRGSRTVHPPGSRRYPIRAPDRRPQWPSPAAAHQPRSACVGLGRPGLGGDPGLARACPGLAPGPAGPRHGSVRARQLDWVRRHTSVQPAAPDRDRDRGGHHSGDSSAECSTSGWWGSCSTFSVATHRRRSGGPWQRNSSSGRWESPVPTRPGGRRGDSIVFVGCATRSLVQC